MWSLYPLSGQGSALHGSCHYLILEYLPTGDRFQLLSLGPVYLLPQRDLDLSLSSAQGHQETMNRSLQLSGPRFPQLQDGFRKRIFLTELMRRSESMMCICYQAQGLESIKSLAFNPHFNVVRPLSFWVFLADSVGTKREGGSKSYSYSSSLQRFLWQLWDRLEGKEKEGKWGDPLVRETLPGPGPTGATRGHAQCGSPLWSSVRETPCGGEVGSKGQEATAMTQGLQVSPSQGQG